MRASPLSFSRVEQENPVANTISLQCRCGQVELQVEGAPIVGAECHCTSCRKAGEFLETLPGAAKLRTDLGGTPYALYRKDRLRITRGRDRLREHRLTSKSPTRRVVATCCNTPMFADFSQGHWLSIYANLWPNDVAPLMEMRTMTSDVPEGTHLDDKLPGSGLQTAVFVSRLVAAWLAMGFRTPKLGTIERLDV